MVTLPGASNWSNYLVRNNDQALMDGQVVEFSFTVPSGGVSRWQVNAGSSGTSDYRRWGLLANSDNVLYREECVGTSNCTTNSLMSYTRAPGTGAG